MVPVPGATIGVYAAPLTLTLLQDAFGMKLPSTPHLEDTHALPSDC